jgi:hypothetical protein
MNQLMVKVSIVPSVRQLIAFRTDAYPSLILTMMGSSGVPPAQACCLSTISAQTFRAAA